MFGLRYWFHIWFLGNHNLKNIFLVEHSFWMKSVLMKFLLFLSKSYWLIFGTTLFLIVFVKFILQVFEIFFEVQNYWHHVFKCVFNTHHHRIAKLHVNLSEIKKHLHLYFCILICRIEKKIFFLFLFLIYFWAWMLAWGRRWKEHI